jgi:hypothetical protein|tara:strand:- start:1132 stop:1443 length:312 start_codon:yes stop_codon:yes gene_type:complete
MIKTVIASFLIIFIIDNLIRYLRNNYTTRRTKDVVNFHIQKYQNIMDEMQENNQKEKELIRQKLDDIEKQNNSPQEKKELDENDLRNINEDLTAFIQRQMANV